MIVQQHRIENDSFPLVELVGAAQCGDRDAFGELAKRYYRVVYQTVFRRLRNEAESQEVCQDIFLHAMCKIEQLNDPNCFGGWIRTMAARMAINRAVRRSPTTAVDAAVYEGICVSRDTPLEEVVSEEQRQQVQLGLERLRSLDRETLVAFYFHGRSVVEMSDEFRSPVGTIKRRLHVARKRLAKELEGTSSVGCV